MLTNTTLKVPKTVNDSVYVLVYIITLMQGDKTEKKEKPGRRGNVTERQREAGKEDAKS